MRCTNLLLLLSGVFLVVVTNTATASNPHAESQIAWIRSKGGFFSPKIEFQHLDKNDEKSPMGVFALEELHKGETLLVIPKECLVTSGGSEEPCDTARNLAKQRKLGDDSEYAPYVNYVFAPQYKHDLPSAWSGAGKHLIKTIIGSELPPYSVTGINFKRTCGEGSGDAALDQDAFLIVVRRSWDDILIPVYDMINHRNGKWYNVDSNSAHEGKDITVFASRDVKQGEQLYLSYNECEDCANYAWTYVLPHIFKDYGFVEQYPRRWNIEGLPFEIDEDEETKELKLTFLQNKPNAYQRKFMRAQLKRLRHLKHYVSTKVVKLDSAHERFMTVEYYEAAMTALELALREAEAESEEQACSVAASGEETCAFREYDALETVPETLKFNYAICDFDRLHRRKEYQEIDLAESLYQNMLFKYSSKVDDTCLYMNDHLHACASFRPHYHEVFVHYPAMFVDEVKRVAFIGGGDNMIVHEILKYPSLELAVGMELDQQVVRSSFKNFGTQPHFDDERLQWFFGDGSKSLLMLPEEYYGTFDVVYVDLQNDVVDILKVADEFSITDAAMLLLKPDGVIARNEDWEFHTSKPFTDYSVDIFYVDLPAICHQGITLGSNTVDFLSQAPKDHGVETIYMPSVDKMDDQFKIWYNYRKSSNRTSAICKEPGTQDREVLTDELRSGLGILMVIEAEEAAAPLEDASAVKEKISIALKNAELNEIAAQVIPDEEGYEALYVLEEGYVMVRAWLDLDYCAFDVFLWSSTNKMDEAKAQLVAAVDSKSVSSYRILTSGMFGVSSTDKDDDDKTSPVGPRIKELCKQEPPVEEKKKDTVVDQSIIDSVLSESIKLLHDPNALVVVLCGEQSSPCNSVGVLEKMTSDDLIVKVVPLWACPNLPDASSPETMLACEASTLQTLQSMDATIDGLVIDVEAPRAMGQVLLKLLTSHYSVQGSSLLTESHVVVSTFLAGEQESSTVPWRRALVDRFRTDIVKYDPAYRAQVVVSDDDDNETLELNVFSSGDRHFYMHLVDVLNSIKSKTQVITVQNGINNYIPDIEPMRFTHDDYDDVAPMQQWESQNPIELQTLYQFVLPENLSSGDVQDTMAQALIKLNGHEEEDTTVHTVGDGSVVFSHWPAGSLVAVWDGRLNVSLNLFTAQQTAIPKMEAFFTKTRGWKMTARDEMPRGTGRVVNFRDEDLDTVPHWAHERPPDV